MEVANSAMSLFIGYLGLKRKSLWNGWICACLWVCWCNSLLVGVGVFCVVVSTKSFEWRVHSCFTVGLVSHTQK